MRKNSPAVEGEPFPGRTKHMSGVFEERAL